MLSISGPARVLSVCKVRVQYKCEQVPPVHVLCVSLSVMMHHVQYVLMYMQYMLVHVCIVWCICTIHTVLYGHINDILQ